MKVVLTGSKGFIGSALLKALKKQKNTYVWLLNQDKNQWNDNYGLDEAVKTCDVIFHVGAISDTTLQDCNEMLYWNYTLSKKLFDLARKHNKKVVYSSSAATYGLGDGIPTNIYGWSKKLAEEYGLKACEKFGKSCGTQLNNPNKQNIDELFGMGYTYAILGSDLFVLWKWADKMQKIITDFRKN